MPTLIYVLITKKGGGEGQRKTRQFPILYCLGSEELVSLFRKMIKEKQWMPLLQASLDLFQLFLPPKQESLVLLR